jgi:hypothetical protein
MPALGVSLIILVAGAILAFAITTTARSPRWRRLTFLVGSFIAFFGALTASLALSGTDQAGASGPVSLNPAHVGATHAGFAAKGSCPTPPTGEENWYGWHFIMPANENFTSLSVTFLSAGTISANPFPGVAFVASPDSSHAYVWTPTADTLLAGSGMTDGTKTEFNLSHVCAPDSGPTPTTTPVTPTNTPVPPTDTPTPSVTSVSQTQVASTNTPTPTNAPETTTAIPVTPTNTTVPSTGTPTTFAGTSSPADDSLGSDSAALTATPSTPAQPTVVASGSPDAPLASPPVSIVLGEKTPGPTPQAPNTGSSVSSVNSLNMSVVLAALIAFASGLMVMAITYRRH